MQSGGTTATGLWTRTIVRAAEHPDVVAVVLGARGLHGATLPAGNTAVEVITRVHKPVAVVPPDCMPGPSIARVLTPLEGSEESSQAIADTMGLVDHRDVEILVLHVHTPEAIPPFQDQPHHQIPAWEREFAARFVTAPHNHVRIIQSVGAPADRILAAARDDEADLVVLGWSQALSPGRAHVVREALAHSPVPVLLVPTA